ncbi:MAG: hypothetical protein IJD92_00750 [Bacilli bacterium]|nr:hypothetical protein [Bacilli bacterium]
MKKSNIFLIIGIVVIALFLLLLTMGNYKRQQPYKEIEKNIVNAMKKYYGQDTNLTKLPSKGKFVKIKVEELVNFGLEINMDYNKDTCVGYGIVTGEGLSHSYKSFIQCNEYKTKNYEYYKN